MNQDEFGEKWSGFVEELDEKDLLSPLLQVFKAAVLEGVRNIDIFDIYNAAEQVDMAVTAKQGNFLFDLTQSEFLGELLAEELA